MPRRHTTRRRALLGAALTTALIATSGCASGTDTAAGHASATFRNVADDDLRFSEPLATTTDLLRPAEEGDPWRIVGSVLDPDSRRSHAAVWTAADGRRWDRHDIDTAENGVGESLAAAAYHGGTGFAVGRVDDGEQTDAAVWTSGGDGWERNAPDAMSGMHDQWAFDIAVGDGGILVAGGENAWGEVRPRLWFSRDGQEWRTVDGGAGGPLDVTGEESVQAISAFGSGFVAVGWRDIDGEQDALAWHSPDGTSWEQVEAPTLRGTGRQNAQSLIAVGDVLIAGGFRTDASGQGRPVVWRSRDGINWSAPSAELPVYNDGRNDASDLSMRSFSNTGNELIATGGSDWRPHLWRSGDQGATWEPLPNPVHGQQFEDGVALVDAAMFGQVTLALGSEPTVLERSGDGWLDATGDSFPTGGSKPAGTSVVLDGDTLMVGGFQHVSRLENTLRRRRGEPTAGGASGGGGGGGDAAPAAEPPATQLPRDRYTGSLWVQDGSGDLAAVDATGRAQHLDVGKINDIATYEGGYVAVGFEDFSVAAQRTASDRKPDGLMWISDDGRQWTRRAATPQTPDPNLIAHLDGDPTQLAEAAYQQIAEEPLISREPAGGSGTRSLEAVAGIGRGFIAVGSVYRDGDGNTDTASDYDTDPLVVVSPDGNQIRGETTGLQGPGTQRYRDVCVRGHRAVVVGMAASDTQVDVAVNVRDEQGGWRGGRATDDSFGGPGRQEAFACAVDEDGFLLVGSDDSRGNSDARVWRSSDGVEWEQVPASAFGGSGNQQARAVAAVPGGGWLIGGNDMVAGDSDIALWRLEPDGEVTRRDRGEPSLTGPGAQTLNSLAVTRSRTVIVGEDQGGVGLWETRNLDR